MCFNIAKHGVGIVSGMAKGIDARAHVGCLDANGYTIAVLGGGPDNIYPLENEVIYYRIKENGLVLSSIRRAQCRLSIIFQQETESSPVLARLLVCRQERKAAP